MKIIETVTPPEDGRLLIARHLRAHNRARMPRLAHGSDYAAYLHDDSGEVIGGAWAEKGLDWMFLDLLFVPEGLRGTGLGRDLLGRVEAQAQQLNARGVWLGTLGFQARGFYEKQGYRVFGLLEGADPDANEYFLRKSFTLP